MPTTQRVLQEIKGRDEPDTVAKQVAAFGILVDMMDARIGDFNANLNQDRLPPPVRQVMQSYLGPSRSMYESTLAKFDPKCQGPNCDSTKFNALQQSYRNSKELQAQVNRFFSPQWLADYQRDFTRMQASSGAQRQQSVARDQKDLDAQARARALQTPATYTPPSQSWDSFMNQYFGFIMFGGLVALYVRRRSTRKVREQKRIDNAKAYELKRSNDMAVLTREMNEAEMTRLGATKEARSARIEEVFDRKTETLSMTLSDKIEWNNSKLSGMVGRPAAPMQGRQRGTMPAAYYLF